MRRICVGSSRRSSRRWWRGGPGDRKSTRLNSSHANISYAVFCLKKKIKFLPLISIQYPSHYPHPPRFTHSSYAPGIFPPVLTLSLTLHITLRFHLRLRLCRCSFS